ncbi:16S rRNA (guanine(966)-N(2))-methyltransferase RsmD [Salipaludibacillus sp. CF4.18]|uniref:16S rRNA (guanine(966)-N(2))-methyltransferase RsmD n=1 Tax=Salipaludibacillus sp. CF4.18 TaxID=3373081 RepID=UPI003EE65057
MTFLRQGENIMRVISGNRKGLKLKSVPGQSTRPTSDKVKESIFNMIGPYFDGGIMLDLYAGSGAIGLESLSRGMEKAIFVDRDKKAIETIYRNIEQAKAEKESEVFRAEAKRALKAIHKNNRKFDFIFLDPPYAKEQLHMDLAFIDTNNLVQVNGFIVIEHSVQVVMEENLVSFKKVKDEKYGDTNITIFQNISKEEV